MLSTVQRLDRYRLQRRPNTVLTGRQRRRQAKKDNVRVNRMLADLELQALDDECRRGCKEEDR
jgi:hypothetical protein